MERRSRLLTYPQLKELKRVPYTQGQLRRLEERGLFPARIKLTPGDQGRVFWEEDEIDAWWATRPRPYAPKPAIKAEPAKPSDAA